VTGFTIKEKMNFRDLPTTAIPMCVTLAIMSCLTDTCKQQLQSISFPGGNIDSTPRGCLVSAFRSGGHTTACGHLSVGCNLLW